MKALKCKTLGAKFATKLLVGNGRRMNDSSLRYWKLQMANRSAVLNKKQAVKKGL